MALMFPDSTRERVVFTSGAEEQFYRACQEQLPKEWRVYHSVTLSGLEQGQGMVDNEADFVLYHPRSGIVVVEVKGGRIQMQDGRFTSINRHGQSFEIKNPFQQALVWKSRFIRYLRKQNLSVPVSHAVCFPSVGEDEFPPTAGIEPAIILGRNRMGALDEALRSLARASNPERFMEFPDCAEELHGIIKGQSFISKMYLRDYIDASELRLKDIESIQDTLVTPLSGAIRIGIEGEAGTGKTMLATLLVKQFRDAGKKVCLLTSNPILNVHLRGEVGAEVEIMTYQECAESFGVDLLTPIPDYTGTKDDWQQFEAPERLHKKIDASDKRYDVIVCDEGQDVQPFWWEPFTHLLADPEESRLYIFFDRSQGVFGSGGSERGFVPEDVLPVTPPYFPLVHNYRTTREIASFSRSFRTGKSILQSHCGRLGYVPEIITYEHATQCRNLLGKLVTHLLCDEGIASHEVTLLSARQPSAPESVLNQMNEIGRYPIFHVGANIKNGKAQKQQLQDLLASRGKVSVSTISGFKGLETPIGILMNLSEYKLPADHPIMASLIYVACTRARHMLYIFLQKDDPKLAVFQKALQQVKASGTFIVEGSNADYEFTGKVTHYNPDRVGWIAVDDPSFQRGSIMFFPTDVQKAGLPAMKVGTKVRFRPRVEGFVNIACDLKLAG